MGNQLKVINKICVNGRLACRFLIHQVTLNCNNKYSKIKNPYKQLPRNK